MFRVHEVYRVCTVSSVYRIDDRVSRGLGFRIYGLGLREACYRSLRVELFGVACVSWRPRWYLWGWEGGLGVQDLGRLQQRRPVVQTRT